jgi:hypothetical protein
LCFLTDRSCVQNYPGGQQEIACFLILQGMERGYQRA